jgi:hypothetical protein
MSMPDVHDALATPRANVHDALATPRVHDALATDNYVEGVIKGFGGKYKIIFG